MSADSLELALRSDKPVYHVGEPIELTLELANRSSGPIDLQFSSSQRYDFEIADGGGGPMWHWSADRMFAQVMGTVKLEPGQSQEYRERFLGRLAAGTYRVTGRITAIGATLRASATFAVR
jgi:hypothetical protein